ncbi:MAG: ATP-binding protein [Bdellovibrionota bacterium]
MVDHSSFENHKLSNRAAMSAQLQGIKEKILSAWESRVRGGIASSAGHTTLVLRNMLPDLLDNLVANLSMGAVHSDYEVAGNIGVKHGQQRATLLDYSVSQVLLEYRVLRQVIFQTLEEENIPTVEVRDVILNVLDEGIEKAITQFASVRSSELEQSNRDLEHFAAIAAHDLKSPLATISGYMEILEDDLNEKIDEQDATYIKTIKRSAAEMTVLIDRLLEYASIDRKTAAFTTVNLNEVASHSVENLKGLIDSTNAKVSFAELPEVKGDVSLLTQLFQNLLNNAIKFRAVNRTPDIRIDVKEEYSQWVFSFKDNGIGFNPQDKDNIFSLFKKVHSLKGHKGQGIGLATARKVAEIHGGTIWAESEVGAGSTFYFSLAKVLINRFH